MADSFEVLLFDAAGKACQIAGRGLLLSGAIALSRGVNDKRKPGDLTAVIMPQGSFGQMCVDELDSKSVLALAQEVPSIDSDATSQQDDSDVEPEAEDAAESNVVGGLVDAVTERRQKFIRREYRRQVKRLWAATEHVYDEADLGIVARSLELLSRAIGDTDELNMDFHEGLCGGFHNDELEEALGL